MLFKIVLRDFYEMTLIHLAQAVFIASEMIGVAVDNSHLPKVPLGAKNCSKGKFIH